MGHRECGTVSGSLKNCPGCGNEMREIGAVGVWQTCCGRVAYGLCATCAATMQNGTDEARAALASAVELSLAADEGSPQ